MNKPKLKSLDDLHYRLQRDMEMYWGSVYTWAFRQTIIDGSNNTRCLIMEFGDNEKQPEYKTRVLHITLEGLCFTVEDHTQGCATSTHKFESEDSDNELLECIQHYGMCGVERERFLTGVMVDKVLPLFNASINKEITYEFTTILKICRGSIPTLILTLEDLSVFKKIKYITVEVKFENIDGVKSPFYNVGFRTKKYDVAGLHAVRTYTDEQSLLGGIAEVAKWDFLK